MGKLADEQGDNQSMSINGVTSNVDSRDKIHLGSKMAPYLGNPGQRNQPGLQKCGGLRDN